MNLFSISELQQFSGIKAHTIRMWEQRYNALQPTRSEGNTRYYDNNQLRRLLNIVSLMESDYKVSELCSMTDSMLFKLLEEKQKSATLIDETNEYFISQLIAAATSFDETHFEKIFSNCVLRLGMRNTYLHVIYPMLNRIGIMWATGTISPAYEHFSSNIIKQKLFSAIDSLPPAKSSRNSWLLFLPENEFHEIGLLFSHYIIRQAGKKVIYLGSNVPFETLMDAIEKVNPGHLLFFLVHHDTSENSQDYIDSLRKYFGKAKLHFSGNEKLINKLKIGKECNWIRSVEELENQLA
jgi:MerR family transcriptional regulator, light-induced transcriptional regulator